MVDDGLVIDLSPMRAVRIDETGRTVHVQGGATWADVDRVTAPLGLAAPGGVVSETGVAGLALSGGVSWQRRRDGMTVDNLVSAEIVLADGRRVRASADEHPDLYWAIRGGGGNFGIVTSFELRLHELGPEVFELFVAYPIEDAARVLAGWRDAVADAPDELSTVGFIWTLPVVPELPEHLRGLTYVGVGGMWAGDPADGERATRRLRELATPLLDMSKTTTYLELQRELDPYFPAGLRYYWKALYLDGLTDPAIEATVDWSNRRPSERTLVVIRHCGGAIARVGAEETAFGDRSSEWMLSIDSTWDDPADDEVNIDWTRAYWDDAHRFSQRGQTYFNFPGLLEEGDSAVRASYGAEPRPPGAHQGPVRPGEPLPAQSEHPPRGVARAGPRAPRVASPPSEGGRARGRADRDGRLGGRHAHRVLAQRERAAAGARPRHGRRPRPVGAGAAGPRGAVHRHRDRPPRPGAERRRRRATRSSASSRTSPRWPTGPAPGTAVLGHSYGGVCALEAALLSGSVGRLILYEPSMGMVSPPAELVQRLEALLAAGPIATG